MVVWFWYWWTKSFSRPFFSYDMLVLMGIVGFVLMRLSGFIAINISDDLALSQINFDQIFNVVDLHFNYLLIPLIPLISYQFWVMTVELTHGWQKLSLKLFRFGLYLSLPILVFQLIRALQSEFSNGVIGFFIGILLVNLLVVLGIEYYLKRRATWLRSGTTAILAWGVLVIVLLFGFAPFPPGQMIVNIISIALTTLVVLIPYFDRKQRRTSGSNSVVQN